MQKITLDVTSAENNATSLATALSAYGEDHFDSVSASGTSVTCVVGGRTAAIFQITDYLPIVWAASSGTYTVRDGLNYNRYKEIWLFSSTIFLPCTIADTSTPEGAVDYRRGCIITKDKAGRTTLVFLSSAASGQSITTAPANGETATYSIGAIPVFSEFMAYQHYRSTCAPSDELQTYAVPVWTGESYTENMLVTVLAASAAQYAPFQITVGGVSYYAVLTDSFMIRAN